MIILLKLHRRLQGLIGKNFRTFETFFFFASFEEGNRGYSAVTFITTISFCKAR